MPNVYSYKARDLSGKIITGQIQADDQTRVANLLREKRLVVLDIKVGGVKSQGIKLFEKKTIPLKQFAVFCRQLATMVKAGVTIMSSISAISAQSESPVLAKALSEIGADLETGKTFTEACQRQKEFFPPLFINMVEAGEASGALDDVLDNMSDYFEGQAEIMEKVKSATTYPSFIGGAAVLVVIILMMTVIPGFATMFSDFGMELPFVTQLLLDISDFMVNYFFIWLPIVIIALVGLSRWLKTTKGKHWMQRTMLKLPKFGVIFKNSAMARFCRSLGILTASGVPMIQGLEIVARVVNNVEYASAILHARKGVSEGMTLSQGLSASPRFTPLLLHMIKVGEEAGALDTMLNKVADFYESEVKYTVERLSAIIEPFLILFLAVIVGTILVAVMLPMFDMTDIVQ